VIRILTYWTVTSEKNEYAEIIWKEECQKNIWTCWRRRMLENNNRWQDKVHIERERFCKIYKIPLTVIVWSCWRNAKLSNAKTNCNSCNGRNKKKKMMMQKIERWGRRGLKYIGNKKQAVDRHRPSWMEEDCVGGLCAQRTVALKEEKEEEQQQQ